MNDYKISKEDLQVEQGEQREEITELKDFLFVACAVLACCCVGAVVIKRRYKLVPMQQPFITAPDGSEGPSGPAPPPPSTLRPAPPAASQSWSVSSCIVQPAAAGAGGGGGGSALDILRRAKKPTGGYDPGAAPMQAPTNL